VSEPTWTVRVRTASTGPATVTARNLRFEVGEALTFGPSDTHVNALEVTLGALASELANGFRALARKRRLPFDQAEVSCVAELHNPLVALGVLGEKGSPAIRRIEGTLYVSSDADEPDLQGIWIDVLARSTLYNTLKEAADLKLRMQLIP
jgi:hypothetical protein